MKLPQLRVKIKSLAEEQRIIKHAERRACKGFRRFQKAVAEQQINTPCENATFEDLHQHRIHHVRPELRAASIAYGLLRGKTMQQMEPMRSSRSLAKKPYRYHDYKRIAQIMTKYGDNTILAADVHKLVLPTGYKKLLDELQERALIGLTAPA